MNLLETLIRPDKEENPERAEVARAANLLQVGEFQLLQLAYEEWHEQALPQALVDRLFTAYMLHNDVPHWARQYARSIIRLDDQGKLDDQDPAYHKYDTDYHLKAPKGVRPFALAALVVALCLGGGLLLADMASTRTSQILPPYFDDRNMPAKQ
ncbi:MAG: hypothetical protein ABFS30_00540 [Pseudomonadota bacterium]